MLASALDDSFDRNWTENVFLATVTGTSGNKVTIIPSVDDVAAGSYAKLSSYSSPTTNDEVLVLRIGGGYLVLGKVVR